MFEEWDTLQSQTQDWMFLESPAKITIACTVYLVFIFYAGPKFMKNRPAFSLKNVIAAYNIFQIIVSFYLAEQMMTNGVPYKSFYQCSAPDYTETPQNVYRTKLMYYMFLLKIVELIETVFFLLRKKQKQISTLHVYHHISTIYLAYFGAKYMGCGVGCICIVINLIVHFFMYMYYLLSSLGNENWKRKLRFFKMAITKIQIVQFLIMLSNAVVVVPCVDRITFVLYVIALPDLILLLYMFVKFYIKSYCTKSVAAANVTSNATIEKLRD